jgi:hypothetical protein
MHASRKILLKHFDARAAEYRDEMACPGGSDINDKDDSKSTDKPVSISFEMIHLIAFKFYTKNELS